MTCGQEKLLTEADDNFHVRSDPWMTEGSWWSFSIPEKNIGGWIYHLTRLNLGMASGGVWVWDDSETSCFKAPYFLNHYLQRLPEGDHDLNDFTWPDGTHLRTLEPLQKYRLTYQDRDLIDLDLTFEGVTDPYVSAKGDPLEPFRLEHPSRVTGSMQLHGKSYEVDCFALRDHSWGVRPEQTLSPATISAGDIANARQRHVVYLYGQASAGSGFFVMADQGYLMRDGERVDLVRSSQTIDRNVETGYIDFISVEGEDAAGRSFVASGKPLSLITRPSNSGFGMIYLILWDFDGQTATGDLQDVWPVDLWSAWRADVKRGR